MQYIGISAARLHYDVQTTEALANTMDQRLSSIVGQRVARTLSRAVPLWYRYSNRRRPILIDGLMADDQLLAQQGDPA